MAPPPRCYYDELGVAPGATDEEVRKAFRRQGRRRFLRFPSRHPEGGKGGGEALGQEECEGPQFADPGKKTKATSPGGQAASPPIPSLPATSQPASTDPGKSMALSFSSPRGLL